MAVERGRDGTRAARASLQMPPPTLSQRVAPPSRRSFANTICKRQCCPGVGYKQRRSRWGRPHRTRKTHPSLSAPGMAGLEVKHRQLLLVWGVFMKGRWISNFEHFQRKTLAARAYSNNQQECRNLEFWSKECGERGKGAGSNLNSSSYTMASENYEKQALVRFLLLKHSKRELSQLILMLQFCRQRWKLWFHFFIVIKFSLKIISFEKIEKYFLKTQLSNFLIIKTQHALWF